MRSGFSLLEVLIVLIIIAMCGATVAMSASGSSDSDSPDLSAYRVVLVRAQRHAITAGRPVAVVLGAGGDYAALESFMGRDSLVESGVLRACRAEAGFERSAIYNFLPNGLAFGDTTFARCASARGFVFVRGSEIDVRAE